MLMLVGKILDCATASQVIKAAAQCLAIERDGAHPVRPDGPVQRSRMVTEGDLEIVPAERQEEITQGVHGRSAPKAGPKGRIQAVALDGDEGDDPLVGGRTRQDREHREQQQMAHAVALSLWTAWIADRGERGKQGTERHQWRPPSSAGVASTDPFHFWQPLTLRRANPGRYRSTAWPWALPGLSLRHADQVPAGSGKHPARPHR